MRMTTDCQVPPDASAFADLIGPDSTAPGPNSKRIPFKAVRLPPLHVTSGRITA